MIPVESATGIILFNDPEVIVENETFTMTVWSDPKEGRPDMIGMDDLPFLFNSGHPSLESSTDRTPRSLSSWTRLFSWRFEGLCRRVRRHMILDGPTRTDQKLLS
jgi:hypothetical protein